jgi:hypothetical protein
MRTQVKLDSVHFIYLKATFGRIRKEPSIDCQSSKQTNKTSKIILSILLKILSKNIKKFIIKKMVNQKLSGNEFTQDNWQDEEEYRSWSFQENQ